ncbi:MAG: protein-L-isoaspartate(D-aspartate) O-methyltransferase [Candidatus Cloacimonadales bacterium]
MKYSDQRKIMILQQLQARNIDDPALLAAFQQVPREIFVADNIKYLAYSDTALTIGENQTISQPYIVAEMLQLLELQPQHSVLEIGTGSGYQTALLAEIADKIYTVERIKILGSRAKRVLQKLGYENINFSISDGSCGWPEPEKRFDRIIVSAGAPEVPPALLQQLRPEGIIVIPTGDSRQQQLHKIREKDGDFIHTLHSYCMFVPLIGKEGWHHA